MTARAAPETAMRHRVLIAATQNRCMKAGATGYLVKPVERNSLIATVKAQMAGRGKPKSNGKGKHA